ncbi:threonine/serine dehydratase [Aestuariivirga litoralis]|uniref:Threonine/serine dehydratase n=1 Tax=Aestuariivirga litoralis TaxID=2650924 RepID=A0A2W2APD4_9HYPH|nr:threonine/serine dehydratase [Aestuariivirga litoralis]PZF77261.1 threonine/serine dehydratase [Aestuariivirga litoralis]
MIAREAISRAASRIAGQVRRTPVIDVMVAGVDLPVTLKLELLQHAGSFKSRGAFNTLLQAEVGAGGVATASGGNHGAAVAYASRQLGHRARIFVPEIASPAKVSRIASYGAEIVQKGANYYEAFALCEEWIAQSGATNVHAYDAAPTLEGQGTLARELEEQAPGIDTLLVAVGGGGLIGGIAAWYQSRVKVVGVEPQTCNALHASLAAGERVKVAPSGLATDSLGASYVGALMFDIARDHIAGVALVTDDDIRDAQRHLWRETQLVTEPGGATALAALLSGAYRPEKGERVGVVVCGANTSMDVFGQLFS